MMKQVPWQYDEFRQVGKDFGRPEEAAVYDASHSDFRDPEQESAAVLDALGVKAGDVVVDFGCGTGTFAILAGQRGAVVHAVDVSLAMLDYARKKAETAGVASIAFHHAGFLTYDHEEEGADYVVSSYSLHHLPDFWKGIALQRLHGMLRPAGWLYLYDAIIEERRALEKVSALIDRLSSAGGNFMRKDAEQHFREEYSTYDWIIDGLLARAGFSIESKRIEDGVMGIYLCRKLTDGEVE